VASRLVVRGRGGGEGGAGNGEACGHVSDVSCQKMKILKNIFNDKCKQVNSTEYSRGKTEF
jgi:hypothetical protein